ncbi:MAG: hypothetical protein R3342_03820 [Lutibacter sp.]|uniref:hypothetical protein n=1 Tax=Lutibacter sp. TaxID=1925666 RepID=UPI00299F0602|nr:hypothetical protein [Lutibacter sp.]MDX1828655.1 hypothetical protein [Lutibacter sp.]
MNLKYYSILLTLSMAFLVSCSNVNKKNAKSIEKEKPSNSLNADSLKLTNLVREAYQWHMKKHLAEFPYKYEKESDSIFTGIDWDKYNQNMELFKKTNYFTNQFLEYHKSIALRMDKSIKKASVKWRNINDGITMWDSEAEDWCNCQDYPDKFWKTLLIDSLKIKNSFASFNLNWKIPDKYESMNYKITARKEGRQWKINSLEGYTYYTSFNNSPTYPQQ